MYGLAGSSKKISTILRDRLTVAKIGKAGIPCFIVRCAASAGADVTIELRVLGAVTLLGDPRSSRVRYVDRHIDWNGKVRLILGCTRWLRGTAEALQA